MRRYGKFVDAIWIHQRMNAKTARLAQAAARRAAFQARLEAARAAGASAPAPADTDPEKAGAQ